MQTPGAGRCGNRRPPLIQGACHQEPPHMRRATVTRKTRETDISVTVDLDGTGKARIATGVGFFDHMLEQVARHSLIDVTVKAKGDLHIDQHHTVEDVGIALGQALKKALSDMKGITRYADVHLPMDEAMTRCRDRHFRTALPRLEGQLHPRAASARWRASCSRSSSRRWRRTPA